MLDDKLLIQIVRYIEFETEYSNKYELINKIKQYGYDIFKLDVLTEIEKEIVNKAKMEISP